MPRQARLDAPEALHHVMGRGIERKNIFRSYADNVHGVSGDELRSGGRRRTLTEPRRVLCWLAVRELGYSGAEVARYLGMTTSCVNRAAYSGERPQVEKYM